MKNSSTYLAKAAINFYNSALEMHSGGETYKEFINSLYILDDDLQNNTCQFYFGLERYKINIGDISENKIKLEHNEYFDPQEYFTWPKEPESRK